MTSTNEPNSLISFLTNATPSDLDKLDAEIKRREDELQRFYRARKALQQILVGTPDKPASEKKSGEPLTPEQIMDLNLKLKMELAGGRTAKISELVRATGYLYAKIHSHMTTRKNEFTKHDGQIWGLKEAAA